MVPVGAQRAGGSEGQGGGVMKRILASIGGGLAVLGMSWLFGFDFDERGPAAAMTAYFAVLVALCVYFTPRWRE